MGWAKLSDFWRFQLAGWAAFVAVTFPLKIELTGSVAGALLLCLVRDGSSFFLTLALRSIYRTYWSNEDGPMAALIVTASAVGGVLQNVFFYLFGDTLPSEGEIFLRRSMAFNAFYERTGLLFAWSFLYFGMRQALEVKQRRLELALARTAQQGAEIQMLRAQMSPHFLFNALTMIQEEVEKFSSQLAKMIQSLADFLRFSLDHSQDDLIPLEREFEAMRDYLQVEKIRLGQNLKFHCQIEEEIRSVAVPGVILQPLVENAVKYGQDTSDLPLRVNVRVSRLRANMLQIVVGNSGHWLESAPGRRSSHLGLQNLRRRLALLYPNNHRLDIEDRDGWVTITIWIPIL